jgi:hypothetical protein
VGHRQRRRRVVRPLAIVVFVARDWFSIRVELVGGGGADLWPRPGRIFAAAPAHTFKALGDAIDDAFARWDRAHLQEFTWLTALASPTRIPTGTNRTRLWTIEG